MNNSYHHEFTKVGFITRLNAACFLLLSVGLVAPLQAETITIGKGSGIVWEGKPFDVTLSGPIRGVRLVPEYGMASISTGSTRCMADKSLVNIAGYLAYQLAPGVGLVPRTTVSASYTLSSGVKESLNGTIGLPETKATAGAVSITSSVVSRPWCLPPRISATNNFYNASAERTSRAVGSWVIVADGKQATANIRIAPLYYGSFTDNTGGGQVHANFRQRYQTTYFYSGMYRADHCEY